MSPTRLLVLGVVKSFQPVHGYDVRRELLSWRADEWAHINPGSIYHALKGLARDGLIEPVPTTEPSARPEKTAYKLTADGETEFIALLRVSLWQVTKSPLDLHVGLSFFGFLSRAELLALLRSRIAQLDAGVTSMEFVIADRWEPRHVVEHFHLTVGQMRAEAHWAGAFVDRLERGEYRTADDI
ncbi:MAG: PadR family transcriptional regulator [Pseudonocardia sp.]